MEPEKSLTHTEFNSLLKATKDERDRCILLLLAGAGLRVGEMTQIRAEDIDFTKGYLHIQALNAKFNKPRTVILLPKVIDAIAKQLAGRSKGWLFPSYRDGHISSRQVQNILDDIASKAGLQEVKRKDKAGKDRHRVHPHMLRHSFAVWSLDSGVPVRRSPGSAWPCFLSNYRHISQGQSKPQERSVHAVRIVELPCEKKI